MKIKNTLTYSLLFCLIFLMSCGPAKMNSTWTKDNYVNRDYGKIAVIGISKNLNSRTVFEQDAVKLLRDNGINAVEGIGLFPPTGGEKMRTAKEYIKIIKEQNLDGVLTMALIDSQESDRYEPGETVYIPSYYRVGRYIVRRYNTIDTPGYYRSSKSFLIEAVLYNVKGELVEGKETMVWTGQSSLVDPSSVASASKSFTKQMVNQLLGDGIIAVAQ